MIRLVDEGIKVTKQPRSTGEVEQRRGRARLYRGVVAATVVCLIPAAPAFAGPDHDFRVEPSIGGDHVELKVKGQSSGFTTYDAGWDPSSATLAAPLRSSVKTTNRRATEPSADQTSMAARVLFTVDAGSVIRGRAVVHSDTRVSDPSTGQVPFQWTESDTAVSLGWWKPAPSGSITWKVERDGKTVASTSNTTYVDRSASARKVAHVYTVSGSEDVTVNGTKASKPYFYQVAVPATDLTAIGRNVNDPTVRSAESNKDVGRAATAESASSLTYNAFIAPKYVDGPIFCPSVALGKVKYYGGDNRDFSTGIIDVSSRLSETVGQSFIGGAFYDNPVIKKTGDTTTYDKDHKLVARKNAGTSGITVTNKEHTSKFVEQTLRFHVANPLCATSVAIDARTYYLAQADGNMRIEGSHDQAPNHEATFYFENNSRYVPGMCVYRRTIKDFYHLAPEFPNATFDISWNPAIGAYPKC